MDSVSRNKKQSLVPVVHSSKPSYLGGRDQEDHSLKPVLGIQFAAPGKGLLPRKVGSLKNSLPQSKRTHVTSYPVCSIPDSPILVELRYFTPKEAACRLFAFLVLILVPASQQAPCGKEAIRPQPKLLSKLPDPTQLCTREGRKEGWGHSQSSKQSSHSSQGLCWASPRAGIHRVHPGMPTQHRGAVIMQPYQPRG
jgi:hypothetical protein